MVESTSDREYLTLAQALAVAIDCLETLPFAERPVSNIEDMKRLLAKVPERYRELAEADVPRWLAMLGSRGRG